MEEKNKKFLDVTSELCPMNFVRVKLALESMRSGEKLEVLIKGKEALDLVPKSVNECGYKVISVTSNPSNPELNYILIDRT